jgi:hypothetical protein
MSCGCRILGEMISAFSARTIPADERRYQERRHQRERTLHTVLGPIRFTRDYYWCPECTRIPFDEELGILRLSYSPGLRRLMGYAASQGSYVEAQQLIKQLAGLAVSDREIQREVVKTAPALQAHLAAIRTCAPSPEDNDAIPIMYVLTDGTGAPMRKDALKGRRGKQPDGSAKTREVKVGCVFTDSSCVEGVPSRDPESSTYLANFKTAQSFGSDLLAEARHRGLAHARQKVVLGDGAQWIWEMARVNFPDAHQILDYYHAAEHLVELHRLLFGEGKRSKQNPLERWKGWLWQGEIEKLLKAVARHRSRAGDFEAVDSAAGYFERNRERMRYAAFREKGFCIGSGVVEAACKTVVAQRMKHSGMFWSLNGAEAVLTYRCAVMNHRYDGFWTTQSQMAA